MKKKRRKEKKPCACNAQVHTQDPGTLAFWESPLPRAQENEGAENQLHGCGRRAGQLLRWCCLVTQSCPTLLQPHGLQHAKLLCSWDSPGKSTGMRCHFLLQRIFPTQGLNLKPPALQADFFFFTTEPPGKPQLLVYRQIQVFSCRNGGTRLQSQAGVFQVSVNEKAAVAAAAPDGEEWVLDPLSSWGCRAAIL